MTFDKAIQVCFRKYVDFEGRASVSEYWWFFLFTFLLVNFAGGAISFAIGDVGVGISYVISLALFLPSLAVSWRRMHDIGKSGAWFFINLIPLVGNIIWIVWCCRPSQEGPNEYGVPPCDC